MRIRFGENVLDEDTRELLVGGKAVRISPKAFQFLELLLTNRPRALSKEEIHETLWPATFVSDGTLTSLLAEVRSAIGEDAHEPRHIRTVYRFGYAFSGTAEEETSHGLRGSREPAFCYRVFLGPREVLLEEGETILGRALDVTIFVDDASISRRHARITIHGATATIEDLGSKNGTWLGGTRIRETATLSDGDEVCLGTRSMTFRILPLPGSTRTAASRD